MFGTFEKEAIKLKDFFKYADPLAEQLKLPVLILKEYQNKISKKYFMCENIKIGIVICTFILLLLAGYYYRHFYVAEISKVPPSK